MKYISRDIAEKIFLKKFISFVKDIDFGLTKKQKIAAESHMEWGSKFINVSFYGHALYASFSFSYRINKIESIVKDYILQIGLQEDLVYKSYHVPVFTSYPEIINNKFYNKGTFALSYTEESVLEFFNLFEFIIKEKMLPLGEQWRDIQVMDRLINENDERTARQIFGSGGEFHIRKLVITWLAGNKSYQSVYERMLSDYKSYSEIEDKEYHLNYIEVLKNLNMRLQMESPL